MKIFLVCFAFLSVQGAENKALPFWKAKPEVYRRIKEDRAVIVSAKGEDFEGKKKLSVITAGRIHAPADLTHKVVMDFDKYADILPYLEKTTFDPKTQNVFVHGSILGYHVYMTIHIKPEKTAQGYRISWECISGHFTGMKGEIVEERVGPEHTEISMDSAYVGETLNIPAFILNGILEFAGQRAASSMRSHIEEKYKKSI